MKIVLIPAKGAVTAKDVETVDLATLQHAVDGDIQVVNLGPDNVVAPNCTLYVNEDGKVNGLPVNEIATRMTRGVLGAYDLVVGDTVLVGPPTEEGDDTGAPDDVVERLVTK